MTSPRGKLLRLSIVTTGGTIEKTYRPSDGALVNADSVLDTLLGNLQLPNVSFSCRSICNIDSLEMTDDDHSAVVDAVESLVFEADGVIVVHGTDRLTVTGELLHVRMVEAGGWPAPVVLTGAMRPYELRGSDALQNITEAILAAQVLDSGVHCVLHSKVLRFPGVVKDPATQTFISHPDTS